MHYQSLPVAELLAVLDRAGRAPDPELIRCCLARGEEIKPALLGRIQRIAGPSADDDVEAYGGIHAAQLLIALLEPAALPYLEQAFRDEERDYLLDWFTIAVPLYGAAAVPFLIRVAHDPGVHSYGRSAAVDALSRIGQHHPGERQCVLDAVRALLPRMNERGEVLLPSGETEPPSLWSWAVMALSDLHDTDSKALVAALDERRLLDRFFVGTGDDLLAAFEESEESEPAYSPFDLLRDYEALFEQAQTEKARRAQKPVPARITASRREPAVAVPAIAAEQRPIVRTEAKVGPNERCPCGSGRKFKKCCGRSQ